MRCWAVCLIVLGGCADRQSEGLPRPGGLPGGGDVAPGEGEGEGEPERPGDDCESDGDCEEGRECRSDGTRLRCLELPCVDGDGDGYGDGLGCAGEDCDDGDPVVYAGADEHCNGVDDDCDAALDEGFDLSADPEHCGQCDHACDRPSEETTCRSGECVATGCKPGHHDADGDPDNGCELACVVANDGVEGCNGRDDDCDGAMDEAEDGGPLTRPCYAGPDGTEGVGECAAGVRTCTGGRFEGCDGAALPLTEVCDGLDNDCDAEADESDGGEPLSGPCYDGADGTLGIGPCAAGVRRCVGGEPGPCEAQVLPRDETCDGVDEDCDGVADEDFAVGQGCDAGLGECVARGVGRCGDDGSFECDGEPGEPQVELCDGLDNDCDGLPDRTAGVVVTRSCYSGPDGTAGVGVCAAGLEVCANGLFLPCEGEVVPGEEVCDDDAAADNDCDGEVDEGLECGCEPPERASCTVTTADGAAVGCDDAHFSVAAARGRAVITVDLDACTEVFVTFEVCEPTDWVLNIGDSRSNNGGGGDGGDSSNDAELQIVNTNLRVIGNDYTVGDRNLLQANDFLEAEGCSTHTITIRDGEIDTDVEGVSLVSDYSLRINPPADGEGRPDAVIYVGLNRVIANEGRTGTGTTEATITVR